MANLPGVPSLLKLKFKTRIYNEGLLSINRLAPNEKMSSSMRKIHISQIHPTHAQSLIGSFALHWYIIQCLNILLADSEGPDQTARMRRLIWAFAVRICTKTSFRMARAFICWSSKKKKKSSKCYVHMQLVSFTYFKSYWICLLGLAVSFPRWMVQRWKYLRLTFGLTIVGYGENSADLH